MSVVSSPMIQTHYRIGNDDGSESAYTFSAAEDTIETITMGSGNIQRLLRVAVGNFDTTSPAPASTDDFKCQFDKNSSGTWTDLTTSSSNVKTYNSSNLTDAGATTNRLTLGAGYTFTAGKVSEDGIADDKQISVGFQSEFVFPIEMVDADLADTNTLKFRLLRNGSVLSYSVTPQVTISKPAGQPYRKRLGGLPYAAAGYARGQRTRRW